MFAIAIHFAEPGKRRTLSGLSLFAGAFTGWGFASSSFGSLPGWIGVAAIGLLACLLSAAAWMEFAGRTRSSAAVQSATG